MKMKMREYHREHGLLGLIVSALIIGIPVLLIYWMWNDDRPHCDGDRGDATDRALCERIWMIDKDIEAQRSVMNAKLEAKRRAMIDAARSEIDAAYKDLEGNRR